MGHVPARETAKGSNFLPNDVRNESPLAGLTPWPCPRPIRRWRGTEITAFHFLSNLSPWHFVVTRVSAICNIMHQICTTLMIKMKVRDNRWRWQPLTAHISVKDRPCRIWLRFCLRETLLTKMSHISERWQIYYSVTRANWWKEVRTAVSARSQSVISSPFVHLNAHRDDNWNVWKSPLNSDNLWNPFNTVHTSQMEHT